MPNAAASASPTTSGPPTSAPSIDWWASPGRDVAQRDPDHTHPTPVPSLAARPGRFSMRLVPGGSLHRPAPRFNGRLRSRGHPMRAAVATAPASVPTQFEGKIGHRKTGPAASAPCASPAHSSLCNLSLQKLFCIFPCVLCVVSLSVAFATPLEIHPHLQHSLPSILTLWLAVVASCCWVRLRVPLAVARGRFGRRGPGHSSVVPAPPTGFRGGSRSDAVPIVAPPCARAPDRGARRAGGRSASQRNGCSRRPRAHRLRRKGAPLHGLPLRGTVPRRGTARAFAPLRVPPLGRSPRRGCPLSPAAMGGALRSSAPGDTVFSQWRPFAIAGALRQWGRGRSCPFPTVPPRRCPAPRDDISPYFSAGSGKRKPRAALSLDVPGTAGVH